MKENDDNNNGSQINLEIGHNSQNFSSFTKSNDLQSKSNNNTKKIDTKDENVKINMTQYKQKCEGKRESDNNHILKRKENKVQEKYDEISGEKEINNNELIIMDDKNNEELQQNIAFIAYLIKDFYKILYRIQIFCDFRENEKKEWKIGFIKQILDNNTLLVKNIKNNKTYKIKMEEISKIAYFRKYSKISKDNFFDEREDTKGLQIALRFIEDFISQNYFINEKDVYEIYYIIHSKIYLGLDSAMKINKDKENEGCEESFRIILNILLFISQYYKYLLDNKDDFIKYGNNIDYINNSNLIDLKVVNKKYAFFSFFDESILLLEKIFANVRNYLNWFTYFEKKLQKFVPSVLDKNIKPKPNTEYYPIYEFQINKFENKNKLLLKTICLDDAYNLNVTYTSEKMLIKATFLAYFVDYFHALNGFLYLFQLSYCSKSINIKILLNILTGLNSARTITASYKNLFLKEKSELLRFVYMFIDQLNENTIEIYDKDDIINLIQKTSKLVAIDKEEEPRLIENMYFNYISKNLLLSKKLEQKISSLNILSDILNNIEQNENKKKYKITFSDIYITKMSFQDFCLICKKNQILQILLNEKSVHEEIIKRLSNIIFVMYENHFGYINKSDEPKINNDKKMVFDVLFNKLIESEQNNEKFSKNIQNIICDFCEILSDDDKIYVFEEIKKSFEKSITKRGYPIKEQLLFIIDYSVQALLSKNTKENENKEKTKDENNNNNKNKNDNNKKNEEIEESEEEEDEEDDIIVNEDNSFSKNDDKLFNLEINDKDYFGLNILKNYLLEEEYKKYNINNEQIIELIYTSIEGIIKIIEKCGKKEKDLLLKSIFFKAMSALEKSSNIAQFLILFDKINNNKYINTIFEFILEEYNKDYGFLTSLMNDMTRYLCLIDSNRDKKDAIIDINKRDEVEERKVYEGLFDNKLNIELRLKIIILLLEGDNNESDFMNFKKLMSTCETNMLAINCLNKLIYLNVKNFEEIFIVYLYDNIINNNKNFDINDLQFYKLCKEIIKRINVINHIFYFMNNKDIAILNCESESKIKGIDVLWNYLIKTNNEQIRNDITNFLANIFLGIKFDIQEKNDIYWKNFIKTIYNKLDKIIQKNDSKDDQAIQGIISLIKTIEKKTGQKGEIIEDISQILYEIKYNKNIKSKKKKNDKNIPKKCIFIGNSPKNSEQLINYDINIDNTQYFYMLRYKLSNYFKIPLNTVTIIIDEDAYDKGIPEELKNIEFDLFNDFNNTYLLFDNLEKKIMGQKSGNNQKLKKDNKGNKDNKENNKNNKNKEKENEKEKEDITLIFRVKSKENKKLKEIKELIKNVPQLTRLLKRKNAEYILDVWILIKDESQTNNNINIIQDIKEILLKNNLEKLDSIFDFNETNIYYISFILSNLIHVINEIKNKNFINEIFIKSKIWTEKLSNIKIENNDKPFLEEIYEKNNIINNLLDIYQKISLKINDNEDISIFILNKLIEYYYTIINESINIDLKILPTISRIKIHNIENIYIENTKLIQEIIIENKNIYDNFIKMLLLNEDKIQYQFKYLIFEGILKNKIFRLNQNLQSLLKSIIDEKYFNNKQMKENNVTINDFSKYLINLFLNEEIFQKLIKIITEISLDKNLKIFNIEIYENNIQLFFDTITYIISKIFSTTNNKYNFQNYISKIILPQILNPIIEDIPLESSFHEIILGGYCDLLLCLLSNSTNYKELLNLEDTKEKELKQYLFEEIIMNKCSKNIFNEKNLDNYKSITIDTSYCFKKAVNLFTFLLTQNMNNNNSDEEEINYYLDKLTNLHRQIKWENDSISDWKLSFNEDKKTSPFVGLKNLGCTCYMNSLLQSFFNFTPFRESLLKCECKEEPKNSLYQIKKLFYSLKYLEINYYSPETFPNNFDDEILDVHQQMDVDEFYINILDKLENRLKGTKNENLIKYFFQGRLNDNLTFQEGCTHHRTNINNFYSIQLQIKNKTNIYQSLDALIEGELMNGDNCIFCPHCNKKLPVIKSQNFKSLPRILLFVLKRFEFNYDTMKKVKINDYYEFPLELNMNKYKSEVKNNENNNYTLKSIVVHMGNCENGHYYAFIKNNNEKWYEFNDTQVKEFDINLLNEETFGGEEGIVINGEEKLRKKSRSAYLLFYEKKEQSNCEHFDNIDAINSFLGKENNNNVNTENKNNIIYDINTIENEENEINENKENNGNGIKKILENINLEMFNYSLNRKLFSNNYQYFILELFLNILNYYYSNDLSVFLMHLCRNLNSRSTEILREIQESGSNLNLYLDIKKLFIFNPNKKRSESISQKNYSTQIINLFKHFIIYFYSIFLKTKEKEYYGGMVDLIKFFINDQPNCANYLIEEFCNSKTIIEFLINCPVYEIKKLLVGILYCAMTKSIKENNSLKINNKKNLKEKEKIQNKQISSIDDEELAKQLQSETETELLYNYEDDNPLEYKNIPKNVLKMIYNILHIIRDSKYSKMNEQRFLYFTIYRFSLISRYTREFLIYKCKLFELLCLILHKDHQTIDYSPNDIVISTYIGPYTVSHNILFNNGKEKDDLKIKIDKIGMYKNENYVYMLFFYLLSYTPPKDIPKKEHIYDPGYSLENKAFINVLLNNIRTKQDAFCFSYYINEKSKNSRTNINNVYEVLGQYLMKVDNNDNINYDYNNYNNYKDHNMNENPKENDPGVNPKYLIMILKKFILSLLPKENYVKKGIKLIFELFSMNKDYYSYSIMMIDLLIELFSGELKKYSEYFEDNLEKIREWLEKWPVPPLKYDIEGISMYKKMKIKYENNLSEKKKTEISIIEINKTQKKIDKLYDILNNDIKSSNDNNYENDLDLSDFKFIIGDIILYQNNERVIEEVLDEQLKISLDINMKNINKNEDNNKKRETWIDIDNPTIDIKKLKGK